MRSSTSEATSICGEACGNCADDLTCLGGKCLGPLSCDDCGLQLAVRDAARGQDIEVEVRFAPVESDPHPRMIDLRIRPSRPVQLVACSPGPAMMAANKSFYYDGATGQPWKVRADGSYQLLIHDFASTSPIDPGLLTTLRFRRQSLAPVSFTLEKRPQTFAPVSADAALQSTPYDRAVVAP